MCLRVKGEPAKVTVQTGNEWHVLPLLNPVFDATHSLGPNRAAYPSKECIYFQKCTELVTVTVHKVWDQDFITTTGCITKHFLQPSGVDAIIKPRV